MSEPRWCYRIGEGDGSYRGTGTCRNLEEMERYVRASLDIYPDRIFEIWPWGKRELGRAIKPAQEALG